MATKPKPPRRNTSSEKPLILKGSKLQHFLPLYPAEQKLRQCASSGEDCVVAGFNGKRPPKKTKTNTVRAEFLRYMILGGCEKSPVAARGIWLIGAYVECGPRFNLISAEAKFSVILAHCTFNATINMSGATIETFSFEGSSLVGLTADRLTATGSLFLRGGLESSQPVVLAGAKLLGDLDCTGGTFDNTLNAQNAIISGNVYLGDAFCAQGTTVLRNISIGGNLNCQGGKFLDPNNAIVANRAKIEGDVDLGNIRAKGSIAFTGSEIGGDFTPQGAVMEGTPALQLRNSNIGGTLIWRGLGFVDGEVDLSGTSCKTLNTGHTSWLRKRDKYRDRSTNGGEHNEEKSVVEYHTKLDNFTYSGFSNLPDNVKSSYWIEWLKQQPDEHLGKRFKPRPWEQLATVLESIGYEEEARDVRVEKQKLLTNFMINHEEVSFSLSNLLHWLQILFRTLFWGPLVSYGYRPGNALVWLFGFVLIGTLIYHQAALQGIMTPTHPLIFKEARVGGSIPAWCAENWVYFPDENCNSSMPSEYSEFHSFIYAADVALPVVNLRMEDDWAPRVVHTDGTHNGYGWWVRTFEWFLISAGWILSLLFVSAVGSSIRR